MSPLCENLPSWPHIVHGVGDGPRTTCPYVYLGKYDTYPPSPKPHSPHPRHPIPDHFRVFFFGSVLIFPEVTLPLPGKPMYSLPFRSKSSGRDYRNLYPTRPNRGYNETSYKDQTTFGQTGEKNTQTTTLFYSGIFPVPPPHVIDPWSDRPATGPFQTPPPI